RPGEVVPAAEPRLKASSRPARARCHNRADAWEGLAMDQSSTGRVRAVARAAALALATIAALAAAPSHAATKAAKPAPRTAAPALPRVPADAGYAVGPRPAWVRPVAADAAVPAGGASVQVLVADRQVRVEGDSLVRYLHFARRVNDASGLSQLGQLHVEF